MVKTKNTNSGAVTGRNQETPTTYVHNTMTPTDSHRSSVDTINPQQNESHEDPNEAESVNIEHALVEEPSAHQHRKYKPKTTHDVYLYVPSTRITEGAVRSYLRDIGVNDIIRISKISQNGHESEFRIIIGDEIVTHTIYGHRNFRKDSIIMRFKRYRSNYTPIRHHGRSNQGESRNQPREMRDRQRDQPAADSRVMIDKYTNLLHIHCCHDQLILMWTQLSLAQKQRAMSIFIHLLRVKVIRNYFRIQPITSTFINIIPTSAGPKYLPYYTHFTYCKLSISSCIHNF